MPEKYLKLEDVRVYYDHRTSSIRMISKDPRLKGSPFRINLSRDSSSAESVYRLLEAEGIIDPGLDDLPPIALRSNIGYLEQNDGEKNSLDSRLKFDLGQTFRDQALSIDLSYINHTLISGGTGSGKTVLLQTLIDQIRERPETELCYLGEDHLKQLEASRAMLRRQDRFEGSPEKALMLFEYLNRTMDVRHERKRVEPAHHWTAVNSADPLHPIFLVVDDLSLFLDKPGSWMSNFLGNLLRTGGAAGIYVFAATHRPDAYLLAGESKANMCRRILMGSTDTTLQSMVLGTVIGHGGELMHNRGRAMIKEFDGPIRTFQAFAKE